MAALSAVFSRLVSMAVTALPVMAAALAARRLLRRAPRRVSYALWAVVGSRLVCPVTFYQIWSIFNLPPLRQVAEATQTMETGGFSAVRPVLAAAAPAVSLPAVQPVAGAAGRYAGELLAAASLLWLAGAVLMLAWGTVSWLRLRRQAATAVQGEDGVWECDGIPTPFVLGLFRPRICIPFRLTAEERAYVLAHERAHLRRGDHWVKPLLFLILAVYWWDPAVWLCRALCCRDMEQCCDEAVLLELGPGVKEGYSRALVTFALDRSLPTAPAFGEHDAARRVRHVLSWRQTGPRAAFLAVSAVVLVALVCIPNGDGRSRVKLEWLENGPGVSFDCDLRKPVQSWALWVDVYEDGALYSSEARISDGFREDGTGAAGRRFTGELAVFHSYADGGGFGGELQCRFEGDGTVLLTIPLPKERYTGSGSTMEAGTVHRLEGGGEILLYTFVLSADPAGRTIFPGNHRDGYVQWLADHNDTVVQFRLVLSAEGGPDAPAEK